MYIYVLYLTLNPLVFRNMSGLFSDSLIVFRKLLNICALIQKEREVKILLIFSNTLNSIRFNKKE